jgi:hypothetical protein
VIAPVFHKYKTGAIPPVTDNVNAPSDTLAVGEIVSLFNEAISVSPSKELKRQKLLKYPVKG